jgi:hypothetical protein
MHINAISLIAGKVRPSRAQKRPSSSANQGALLNPNGIGEPTTIHSLNALQHRAAHHL